MGAMLEKVATYSSSKGVITIEIDVFSNEIVITKKLGGSDDVERVSRKTLHAAVEYAKKRGKEFSNSGFTATELRYEAAAKALFSRLEGRAPVPQVNSDPDPDPTPATPRKPKTYSAGELLGLSSGKLFELAQASLRKKEIAWP